jgi:hypothetical protein
VTELQKEFPSHQIEVWSFDEHRVGLKPILRKVWAPIGERPSAVVCHRYEWVYLYGFVNPPTGKTEWFIIPRVNCEWLSLVLEKFALQTGAGPSKIILLYQIRVSYPRYDGEKKSLTCICLKLPTRREIGQESCHLFQGI